MISRWNRWRLLALALFAALVAGLLTISGSATSGPALGRALRTTAPTVAIAAATNPLDPLTPGEVATTFRVIETYAKFPPGARFPIVKLNEPPKSEVLAWSPGKTFRRESFANVYEQTKNQLFEAVVDLRAQRVVSWIAQPGDQPAISLTEYTTADSLVRGDSRWQASMRSRGIDPNDVYLDGWAPGDILLPAVPAGTRLMRELSFFRGTLPNPYDRPIEGVVVTVDMNHLTVVDFVDSGIRPVNKTNSGSSGTTRTTLKPLNVTQPNGPSFAITGDSVAWQGWHFHVGFSPREGLVLQQIGYEQKGAVRPIIYRISLDEIFVPYAVPDPNWAWRTALDVGEYNLGQYVEPLQVKVDVPGNAVFMDEVAGSDAGSIGGPIPLPHAIALYERDGGSLWDRTDPTTATRDARFSRELVVVSTMAIGNYTYSLHYVFRMDGGMNVEVGATGTTLNQGVATVAEGDKYGTSVAQGIAAPSHQHFFNFRIDFDVDGSKNRVVEENTHSVSSTLQNAFVTDDTVLATEQFRDLNPATDRRWRVESATRKNAIGKPTAYELQPIDSTVAYASPNYVPLQHAAFAQHPFWVSQFRQAELYATGDYPNQGPVGDGLAEYIAAHSNVDGQDLVVWYTLGLTHVPAVEEYPVMTTDTISFALRPAGFFDQNPALDAP
jgi:primary-amine oxidase